VHKASTEYGHSARQHDIGHSARQHDIGHSARQHDICHFARPHDILTEALRRSGCLINLSFISKSDPFTQHLSKFHISNTVQETIKSIMIICNIKGANLTIKDLSFTETLHNAEFSCKCCAFWNIKSASVHATV
jgi:hypothetical protein